MALSQDNYNSNRTFMELKYRDGLHIEQRLQNSNRTFMELKYNHVVYRQKSLNTPIAPLWN